MDSRRRRRSVAPRRSVKKKTLEPAFHEQFQWSVSPASSGDQPSLTLNVQDWDAVSKNDAMGSVEIKLDTLLERKGEPLRKWYALDTGGAIEVIAQWRHSPTNAWKPFAPPKFPDKAPNELRVGLSQTVSRPQLRELSEAQYTDTLGSFSVQGNPDLETATLQNFDVRYETYPTPDEIFSMGLFYKRLDKPIEQVQLQAASALIKSFLKFC